MDTEPLKLLNESCEQFALPDAATPVATLLPEHWEGAAANAVAVAALRRPGDLAAVPEQIVFFGAHEALPRPLGAGLRRQDGFDPQSEKRLADPFMNRAIAFLGGEFIPAVGRWNGDTVRPIR